MNSDNNIKLADQRKINEEEIGPALLKHYSNQLLCRSYR